MLSLNNRVRLVKKRKCIGRGGSRGGTSGKGGKGQNSRSGGGVGLIFEGGQMPLVRRLPKRGFCNERFADVWVILNLSRLNDVFEAGAEVTKALLIDKGVIKCSQGKKLKILGKGILEKQLIVHADAFSKSAEEAIKRQGGQVHVTKET